MTTLLWMRILHFAGFTIWVAGLVALATTLRVGVRVRVPGILADVGATLALVSGLHNAITRGLFSQPWLHIKLTLVAVLIGAHVALRVKSRKERPQGGDALLAAVLAISVVILFVIVMRPLGR
jgi:uncharacterized membrane protein